MRHPTIRFMALAAIMTTTLALLPVCVEASPAPLRFESEEKTLVEKIYELTSSLQIQKDVPYTGVFQWHKAQGVYKSNVKLNLVGNPVYTEARDLFNVFDNNMFATAWVTSNLLEAYKYGRAPKPTDGQLDLALKAIGTHKDKNSPDGSTVNKVFWPQVYNKTDKYWRTEPGNLLNLFELVEKSPIGVLETILEAVGLKALAKDLKDIVAQEKTYLEAFHVPADFDDTYVNLGLGALLLDMKDEFASSWGAWQKDNTGIQKAIDSLKKYAYRPFSTDRDVNTIDPRTYFYLRGFLDNAKAAGQDIALATTWVENINQTRRLHANGNPMPFNINNVDVTVAADVVFGLTSGVLSGLLDKAVLQDPQVEQIYLNTSSLLAYEIANNLTSRPDLALTYYPSVMEYYWFVARILNTMETALSKGPLPLPVMQQVYELLLKSCTGPMTSDVIAKAVSEGVERSYFDDFLGNGDTDFFNNTDKHHEDRMFTTAMASNALLYTWTVYNETTGTLRWRRNTPAAAKTLVDGTTNWLREYTLSGTYKPWNAFFSGSVKGFTALPFWYPGNRFEFLNGTAIKDWNHIPKDPFFYGVEGYISESNYNKLLKEKHFGIPTPMEFPGYNNPNDFFPFWTSESYTYSCSMLALARYENIVG